MNWINLFECMCYIIVALALIDLIRKRDYNALFTFGAAALVGFAMELLAVTVTDIYYYNNSFWLSLGKEPHQFPFFGGLMWGGLTVYGIKLAQKLRFGKVLTTLSAGMFIVTMDLFLDVIAIRLDGGFWTWVGNPINFDITASTFMSVIWVNFLGYMIEVPAVTWLTLKKQEKVAKSDWKKQTIYMLLIALGGILITAVGSLIALLLNSLTADVFSCVAFLTLWFGMLVIILRRVFHAKVKILHIKDWNYPMIIFWFAMYGYCIAGLLSLGVVEVHLWFVLLAVAFMLGTLYMCVISPIERVIMNKRK